MSDRIQKIIANAGFASRRAAEKLILGGKVKVNGQVIRELGSKAEETDVIEVSGKQISFEQKVYFLLNKPKGYISTVKSFKNQKPVIDLIKTNQRIYPVGRLDKDTTGVLILTNDGDLTHKLTHPKTEIKKTYIATVYGEVLEEIEELKKVNVIDGITYSPVEYKILFKNASESKIELTIHEGKNHEVKILMAYIGHPVSSLKRIKFAGIGIKGLNEGSYRQLTSQEVTELKKR